LFAASPATAYRRAFSPRTALIWFPDGRAYFDLPRNEWCYFRKTFTLPTAPTLPTATAPIAAATPTATATAPAAPAAASLRIFADSRYRLFVNGAYIARGPARSDPRFQTYDIIDLAPHLRAGVNLIAVQVLYYGYNTGQHIPRVPCLLAELDVATPATSATPGEKPRTLIRTDGTWKVHRSTSFDPDAPRVNGCQGAIEIFDARNEPPAWTQPGFDDTAWPAAKTRPIGNDQIPYNRLLPRDIPLLEETILPAARISAPQTVAAHDTEPFFPQRARLELDEIKHPVEFPKHKLRNTDCDTNNAPAPNAPGSGPAPSPKSCICSTNNAPVPHAPRSGSSPSDNRESKIEKSLPLPQPPPPPGHVTILTLDFARITPGYLQLTATAPASTRIDIAYAEDLYEGRCALFEPSAQRPLDAFILNEGRNDLEIAIAWKGFRYAQLIIRHPANATAPLTLHHAGMRTRMYPANQHGHVSAPDPFQQNLHAICAHALRGCMQDGFIDSPSREQQQWMGDARWQAIYNYYLSGDPRLHRRLLHQIAHSQDAEGLTKSRYPDGHENWSPIPSYCLAWVTSFDDYHNFTGDLAPAAELWPNIIMALRWFTRYENKNGLLENVPFWPYIDLGGYPAGPQPDTERGGIVTALNLLYLESLRAAARLAAALNDTAARAAFTTRADALATAITSNLWDDTRSAYPDSHVNGQFSGTISEPTNALALLHLAPAASPAETSQATPARAPNPPATAATATATAQGCNICKVASTATTAATTTVAPAATAAIATAATATAVTVATATAVTVATATAAAVTTAATTAAIAAARAPRILEHFGAPGTVISSPYSMPLVIRALLRNNRATLAWQLVRARYRPIVDAGLGTTWEYWKVFHPAPSGRVHTHSASHAWGAGPLILFFEGFAGLRILEPALRRIELAPQLPEDMNDLAFVIPTPDGKIEGRHRRAGNEIQTTFTVPKNTTVIVAGREYPEGSHTATIAP
jgi:hypothetical protein